MFCHTITKNKQVTLNLWREKRAQHCCLVEASLIAAICSVLGDAVVAVVVSSPGQMKKHISINYQSENVSCLSSVGTKREKINVSKFISHHLKNIK